jgi:serine/threonine protein kinase
MVALKMLAAGSHASPAARRRLRAESETIARFRHANVVTIHDVGEHQGVPYLCLELVEGGSLADWLSKRTKPLSASKAARVVAALARVVQEAHNLGIIHRDLKPANVLLSGSPNDSLDTGRLKLTDFGLAKRLADADPSSSFHSGMVLGTPAYMAPEMACTGKTDVGPAVDIYGLGAILYELLVLRAPFRGGSPFATVLQVLRQLPERPSRIVPTVPLDLEEICLRCLEKDKSRRYASAAELGDVLDRFLSGESASFPGRIRRHWSRAGIAATVIACAAAIASITLLWSFSRDRSAVSPTAAAKIEITRPESGGFYDLEVGYHHSGRITLSPPTKTAVPPAISFDVNDDRHWQYLEKCLTTNAKLWTELAHDVAYWGPIDDSDWFEVVYKIPFDFPVRAASIYASLCLIEHTANGYLEVSTDPRQGWTTVARGNTSGVGGGPFDISEAIRGGRNIYVRARMKGRDDQNGSSMAQYMRTSTSPDGHVDLKNRRVFELRASDRDYPIVTASVRWNDGSQSRLWVRPDGEFDVDRTFEKPGHYFCTVTACAGKLEPVSETFDVWINSRGSQLAIDPTPRRIRAGEIYHANGTLRGLNAGPWSGVVDYDDGSGEHALDVLPGGKIILEHRYMLAGKHVLRVTLENQAGEMVTERPTCIVLARH